MTAAVIHCEPEVHLRITEWKPTKKITGDAVPVLHPKKVKNIVWKRPMRVGHAVPIKLVKRYVKEEILLHVGCISADCQVCLTEKFPRRFEGSPKK